MTQKYIHKHARTVVTEICYALVQASYGDIHHGEKMVLYRSEGGDNWLRSTGEFIDKFVYMHQVGAPSYWKHKKTGGKYTVVHDPVVCASNIMGEMDMVIVYEFEDGRRCAMETHHFAGMFEVFTPAKSEPIEGQIRETEDKKEVFWGGKWMTYWEKPKHTMCFKASREQLATQTAASIKRAVNRADGHPYEYVKTVEIPVPKWVDIGKDKLPYLESLKADWAQNYIHYYMDGPTHVAIVKRVGYKSVPIRGDNLAEVMRAANQLLWIKV